MIAYTESLLGSFLVTWLRWQWFLALASHQSKVVHILVNYGPRWERVFPPKLLTKGLVATGEGISSGLRALLSQLTTFSTSSLSTPGYFVFLSLGLFFHKAMVKKIKSPSDADVSRPRASVGPRTGISTA